MERDLAHEHDMEMLRREQLRADIGDDELEYDYDDLDSAYYDGDPDEWDGE